MPQESLFDTQRRSPGKSGELPIQNRNGTNTWAITFSTSSRAEPSAQTKIDNGRCDVVNRQIVDLAPPCGDEGAKY